MTERTITAEELEKFSTSHRREILFYLRQLINDGDRISVIFNEGNDTFLTVLLDIDESRDLLIFDWGSSEDINRRLLQSERNLFVCAPQGIRNQFVTGRVEAITHQQRRAFATRLPERYTRLQFREFFRLILPLTRRPLCSVSRPAGTLRLPVIDISIGGLALEAAATPPFEIGERLPGASVVFKDGQRLQVELEVRNIAALPRGNKVLSRIGCSFVALDHAAEHLLQRFITDVQREERARLGGG